MKGEIGWELKTCSAFKQQNVSHKCTEIPKLKFIFGSVKVKFSPK